MKFRLVSDRIMRHGFELQYKLPWWPFWHYVSPKLECRKVYFIDDLDTAIREVIS